MFMQPIVKAAVTDMGDSIACPQGPELRAEAPERGCAHGQNNRSQGQMGAPPGFLPFVTRCLCSGGQRSGRSTQGQAGLGA